VTGKDVAVGRQYTRLLWIRVLASNGPEILTASTKRLQQTAGNGPTNSNGQHQAVPRLKTTLIKDGCLLAFRMGVVMGQHGGYNNTTAVHRPFDKE
jgi:hypothetical protein